MHTISHSPQRQWCVWVKEREEGLTFLVCFRSKGLVSSRNLYVHGLKRPQSRSRVTSGVERGWGIKDELAVPLQGGLEGGTGGPWARGQQLEGRGVEGVVARTEGRAGGQWPEQIRRHVDVLGCDECSHATAAGQDDCRWIDHNLSTCSRISGLQRDLARLTES